MRIMNTVGRRKRKTENLIILSASILFLVISLLSALVFHGRRRQLESFTIYETQRFAGAVFDAGREAMRKPHDPVGPLSFNDFNERLWETFSDRLTGIGFYNAEGDSLFTRGSAPGFLPLSDETEHGEYLEFNREHGTLLLVRETGFYPSARWARFFRLQPAPAFPVQFLYFEVPIPNYWKHQIFLLLGFIFTEVLSAAVLSILVILLIKNIRYRQEILGQKQLVILGMAARTLAHEVKNPLSAILIQTGILKKLFINKGKGKKGMETEGQREVGIVDEEVNRLRLLADRVGDYLKDPVGNPEVFDAVEEIREITARFEGPILISAAERETILIRFDRLRFRSVVENLLKNGRESGGDEIKVSVVRKKRQVEILISDRGKGLPRNSTDTGNVELFNPFYTTKEQGSGIGLAISLRFVEAARGALHLEPRENGGTVAIVNLPRAE